MELSILPSSILTLLLNLTVIINLRHDTGRFSKQLETFAGSSISLQFIEIISDTRRNIVCAIKLAKSFITLNSSVQYNVGGGNVQGFAV